MSKSAKEHAVTALFFVAALLLALVLCTSLSYTDTLYYLPQELTPRAHLPIVRSGPTPTPTPQPADVRIVYVENDAHLLPVLAEYVQITNQGGTSQNMTGWDLSDQAQGGTTFTFPTFTLAPQASVKVWTKCGTNSDEELFWCHTWPVWDNNGDTVYLRDQSDTLVDTYSY